MVCINLCPSLSIKKGNAYIGRVWMGYQEAPKVISKSAIRYVKQDGKLKILKI